MSTAPAGGDRVVEETTHGVAMYPPSEASAYYRIVWRTPTGQRKQTTAGRERAAAWAQAWRRDRLLAAEVGDLGQTPLTSS